jgi:hypothetical protein
MRIAFTFVLLLLAASLVVANESQPQTEPLRRFIIEQVKSNHTVLRDALLERGWIDAHSARPNAHRLSRHRTGFDFKWTWSWTRAKISSDSQIVNHFPNFEELTTVCRWFFGCCGVVSDLHGRKMGFIGT